MFARAAPSRALWRALASGGAVLASLRRPDEERRAAGLRVVEFEPAWLRRALGRRAGVGQEHDRRFQALGGVDGHHPHAVAFASMSRLIATSARLDLGEKGGQRRRRLLFEGERERHEFVDRVGRLGPEPPEQRAPSAVLADETRVEIERR